MPLKRDYEQGLDEINCTCCCSQILCFMLGAVGKFRQKDFRLRSEWSLADMRNYLLNFLLIIGKIKSIYL